MDASGTPHHRGAWPEEIRSAAQTLGAETDLSASEVRERIAAEHDAAVPVKTVHRWLAEVRGDGPIDRRAVLADVADRASLLLRAEVLRQERRQPQNRDLSRIDQVARTLKTLSSIEPSKSATGAQTLADLNRPAEREQGREAALSDAPRAAA